jgi:hypothetical protein
MGRRSTSDSYTAIGGKRYVDGIGDDRRDVNSHLGRSWYSGAGTDGARMIDNWRFAFLSAGRCKLVAYDDSAFFLRTFAACSALSRTAAVSDSAGDAVVVSRTGWLST